MTILFEWQMKYHKQVNKTRDYLHKLMPPTCTREESGHIVNLFIETKRLAYNSLDNWVEELPNAS